jgi:beta-carotene 15,15'-dioxygenase
MPPPAISARDSWFQTCYARLTLSWCLLASALAGAALLAKLTGFLSAPVIELQMVVLGIGVGLFGVPHGGLDHLVARRILLERGARSMLAANAIFLFGYTVLALLVLFVWWWMPVPMLLVFLAASAWHFALRDVSLEGVVRVDHGVISVAHLAALGAAPILIPCLIYPADVGIVFGWLSNTPAETWMPPWAPAVSYTLVAVIGAVAMLTAKGDTVHRTQSRFEVAGTVLIFIVLPPLLAFAWYFCFLHSLRHLLTLAHRLSPGGYWEGVQWVAMRSLPLTILTLAIAVIAYKYLDVTQQADGANLARVIFWGLAALTFPHMLLTAIWERQQSGLRGQIEVVGADSNRVIRVDELK